MNKERMYSTGVWQARYPRTANQAALRRCFVFTRSGLDHKEVAHTVMSEQSATRAARV
jgi:hypothetical protein